MRIDKFLKVCRILKRREIAKQLCEDGDVKLNGKVAKPMSEVNPGDLLEITLGRHHISAKILEIRPFAKKEDADKMVEILKDEVQEEAANLK